MHPNEILASQSETGPQQPHTEVVPFPTEVDNWPDPPSLGEMRDVTDGMTAEDFWE